MNSLPIADQIQAYKVILIFTLAKGMADEELRRSNEPESFPSILAKQEGFVSLELVKIDDDKTMSVQTWQSPQHWWKALEAAKSVNAANNPARPNILVSRDFFGGTVVRSV
jgi:heme-degrading monooxygenase HmoA